MTNPTEKVLKRIGKLLAMAADVSSPREAAIAAKSVRKLMDKYELKECDIEGVDNSQMIETVVHTAKQRVTWLSSLVATVGMFCDVRPLLNRDGMGGVQFVFQGYKADVGMAHKLFDFLVETQARLLKASGVNGRGECNFYRLGFCQSMWDNLVKLSEERKALAESQIRQGRGLMVVKKDVISDHFGSTTKCKTPKTRAAKNEAEYSAAVRGETDANSVRIEGAMA